MPCFQWPRIGRQGEYDGPCIALKLSEPVEPGISQSRTRVLGERMLKISLEESANSTRLILEGRLVGPWVQELRRVCEEYGTREMSSSLTVDLCGVTGMDAQGQAFLHELFQQGASLTCSDVLNQYLVELMSRKKRTSQGACRPCHSGEVKLTSANGRS